MIRERLWGRERMKERKETDARRRETGDGGKIIVGEGKWDDEKKYMEGVKGKGKGKKRELRDEENIRKGKREKLERVEKE